MATTVDQVPERSRMGGDMRRAVGIRETGTHETIRNVGDAPVQSVISGRLRQLHSVPVLGHLRITSTVTLPARRRTTRIHPGVTGDLGPSPRTRRRRRPPVVDTINDDRCRPEPDRRPVDVD